MYNMYMNIKRAGLCLLLTVLIFIRTAAIAVEEVYEEELFKSIKIKENSNLTIANCVAAAFKNSPKIKRQKYNLDAAKSEFGMAKSQYFPVISAGVGFYNENNSDNIYYDSHYRELPSVGVAINKLIWDFGKTTAYIKMEEFYKIGAEYEFVDSICSTLFDVKAKYYNVLRRKALLESALTDVKINEKFVEAAKSKQKIDLITANSNLNRAKVSLYDAQKDYDNAKIDLNNSMYLESNINYNINPTSTFSYNNDFTYEHKLSNNNEFKPKVFPFALEKAVEIAYENSPDLQVLITTENAMKQALKYIKKTYFPDLTGSAGYGFNKIIPSSNNSLQVGVSLNSSVNIMELKHNINRANAQLDLASNEITLFKKDLYFEVKHAFNNVEKSEKEINIAKLEASQAFESLKEVEKLYKSDELNYVALQKAREDYISAINKYINSLYDYNIALIQVEMAMHYHIADIHHKSEHAVHHHSDELIEHLNEVLNCDEKDIEDI